MLRISADHLSARRDASSEHNLGFDVRGERCPSDSSGENPTCFNGGAVVNGIEAGTGSVDRSPCPERMNEVREIRRIFSSRKVSWVRVARWIEADRASIIRRGPIENGQTVYFDRVAARVVGIKNDHSRSNRSEPNPPSPSVSSDLRRMLKN